VSEMRLCPPRPRHQRLGASPAQFVRQFAASASVDDDAHGSWHGEDDLLLNIAERDE
jgi:hypothetical protein